MGGGTFFKVGGHKCTYDVCSPFCACIYDPTEPYLRFFFVSSAVSELSSA